jgi:prephenate dehydrogenase
MIIGIAGLGLIGGSFAKAVKAFTLHDVLGFDADPATQAAAEAEGAVDGSLLENLGSADIVLVALRPGDAVDFILNNARFFSKRAVVVDCCGVKRRVCERVMPAAREQGFTFVGGHPMAGLERSGYAASTRELYKNASMILTPDPSVPPEKLELLSDFFKNLGFSGITLATPEEHDRIIAYTSQLAHIVSGAYIKSPTAARQSGFSAGSFRDMTRVAFLNEEMWGELILDNPDNLLSELDTLVARLLEYREAISEGDRGRLISLLKDGKERKIACEQQRKA